MIHFPALCLAGCVVCAGLILSSDSPSFRARLPLAKTVPAAPEIRKALPEVLSSADEANSPLRDVRLTGVVTAPELRIAIFAMSGTNPLVLSEGETLKEWRLDRISPGKVLLSGPAGTIKLEPKLDASLCDHLRLLRSDPANLSPAYHPTRSWLVHRGSQRL